MRKLIAALFLLLPAGPAFGFACLQINGHCTRWADNHATLQSALDHIGPLLNGTLSFDENAINAANDWNAVGTAFQFTVNVVQQINEPCGVVNPPAHECSNTGPAGDNPVVLRSTFCGQGFGDILSLTSRCVEINTSSMINAPVFVNSNVEWNAYDGPLRVAAGGPYDIRRVLLHEFGDVLGLDHPDENGQTVVAIMNSHVSDLYQLQPDDIAGIRSLYPNVNPTPTPSPATSCVGDCNLSGEVTVDELLTMAGIALGNESAAACIQGIANNRSVITIDQVLTAVNNAVKGCGLVQIEVGKETGAPGGTVKIPVTIRSSRFGPVATANDISYGNDLFNLDVSNCTISPAIAKTLVISAVPPGPDTSVTTVRGFVQSLENTTPIPDGTLYTCLFGINPSTLPGCYTLRNDLLFAYGPDGSQLPNVLGADGAIGVSLLGSGGCPSPTPTVTVYP